MHLLIVLPYSRRLNALFASIVICLLDADAATCIPRPCLTEAHVSTPHHVNHKCIACLCPAKCTRLPSQHAFQWWKFVSAWRLACRYERMLGSVMLEVKKLRTIQRVGSCMDTAHKDRKFWKYMVSLLARCQVVHHNPVSVTQDACSLLLYVTMKQMLDV